MGQKTTYWCDWCGVEITDLEECVRVDIDIQGDNMYYFDYICKPCWTRNRDDVKKSLSKHFNIQDPK